MKWTKKIQKLGRIQIPTHFLKAYNHKEGDPVKIEDSEDGKKITITFSRVDDD